MESAADVLPEVLDVILNARQRQGVADRAHEGHRLLGRTPVYIWRQAIKNKSGRRHRQRTSKCGKEAVQLTWLLHGDVNVEE